MKNPEKNNWREVEADFDFPSTWGEDDGQNTIAAGSHNQYTSTKIDKPISSPYVYTVSSYDPNIILVNMFGADVNVDARDFGNKGTIHFFYSLSGYFGGGVTGYAALLVRTSVQPVSFGRVRMDAAIPVQLSQPLAVLETDPTGVAITYPTIQYLKINQFNTGAVETECDITIFGGTQISYNHYPAGTYSGITYGSPSVVTWYFWAADVASLTRSLEGKGLIKDLKSPETYLQQTIKLKETLKKITGKK